MRLGYLIEKNANGEIHKARTRDGMRYFVWKTGASVGIPFVHLTVARAELGIDTAPKKAA